MVVDVDISHDAKSVGVSVCRVELVDLVKSSIEAIVGPNVAVPQVQR